MTNAELPTAPDVDLDRYVGTWFEIWRLPLKWEDDGASDITATYSINDNGKIRVDNRCMDGSGKPTQAVGEATPQDETNAKLEVSFLPTGLRWLPFTKGDYWVLKLDPEYRYSLVGTPDRENLWLLARTASIPLEVDQQYRSFAQERGFDLQPLIVPRQSGAVVSDSALEAADN